jgi:hypothetical protein
MSSCTDKDNVLELAKETENLVISDSTAKNTEAVSVDYDFDR